MIAIIKGVGTNLASIQFALDRLNKPYIVSDDATTIQNASHVIIPGVSTAQRAMDQLQKSGLTQLIKNLKQPVLGICSGMQILFSHSEEGNVEGLGIFKEKISLIPHSTALVVPHMGWNKLVIQCENPLCDGIENNSYVYYVHSFAGCAQENTLAYTDYGKRFSAIVVKDNYVGMQFHPERSGTVGATLLRNFLRCTNEYYTGN